jgi:short-subunit dehydrogenase
MNQYFKDKIVIVTGASSGIGKAVAIEFSINGCKVVLAARSESSLSILEKKLLVENPNVIYIPTDVSKEEDCRLLIEKTIQKYGRLDILVNNAGLSMKALFIDSDIRVLHRLMNVNFWGTVYCTKYALPYLISSKGSLVGVSSVAGFHGLPLRSGYSASKFAIQGFLETLRIENLSNGLHILLLAPGFTSTEIRKHALLGNGSEQGVSQRDETKMMTPEYVAKKMLTGIKRKKRNMILSWEGRLTALFQRIIPNIVDRLYFNSLSGESDSPLK